MTKLDPTMTHTDGRQLEALLVQADRDEPDTMGLWLFVNPDEPEGDNLVLGFTEGYDGEIYLTPDEAVEIRDALNAYLDAHDPLVEVAA